MMQIGAQYNARLYEVRRYLVPKGWCIDRIAKDGGQNTYKIVPVGDSEFYEKNRHKFG